MFGVWKFGCGTRKVRWGVGTAYGRRGRTSKRCGGGQVRPDFMHT